ncbi:MAG TPA: hypothetical protein PLD12_09580 [Bacteroidales bacterium]|nr:hypothetical protein [Bacteroidales bacterium]HPO66552.1 hypothetical protein [Bacteroidales bacterium]
MRLNFYKLNELNFVEFNITGDNQNCQRLSEDSYYLDGEIFNIFVTCFENSNELYEYFEPTKYNARKIVVLRNELLHFLQSFEQIHDKNDFLIFLHQTFLGGAFIKALEQYEPNWHEKWNYYHQALLIINRQMIEIVDRCIDESRILWIIGY